MLNTVTLFGRLTAAPELKTTPGGKYVMQFTLAVDRDFATDGKQRETDFIPLVAWGDTAAFIARNFDKGKPMIASGRLQIRSYTTREGAKRYVTEVIAERVYFAGDKKETGEAAPSYSAGDDAEFEVITGDMDLPF